MSRSKDEKTDRDKMKRDQDKTEKDKAGDSRDSKLKSIWLGWKHTIMNIEQTDLHSEFVRMYDEAKDFGRMTRILIDRVKHVAQPWPAWQKQFVPPTDEYTDTELLVETLKEDSQTLQAKAAKTSEFYKRTANAMLEVNGFHRQFLINVLSNTLKPMEKYAGEDLDQIRQEYDKLIRYKKLFDEGRNKLKSCKPDRIEETFDKLNDTKTAFEAQANLVTELLRKLPDHINSQRIAMRQFVLAQQDYFKRSNEVMTKMLQENVTRKCYKSTAGPWRRPRSRLSAFVKAFGDLQPVVKLNFSSLKFLFGIHRWHVLERILNN